jgi:hypothetical protein
MKEQVKGQEMDRTNGSPVRPFFAYQVNKDLLILLNNL